MRTDDDPGATAEWYLTVRCANLMCARLIAFQKSVDQGDNPDLRIAITRQAVRRLSTLQGRDSFPPRSNRAASGYAHALRMQAGISLRGAWSEQGGPRPSQINLARLPRCDIGGRSGSISTDPGRKRRARLPPTASELARRSNSAKRRIVTARFRSHRTAEGLRPRGHIELGKFRITINAAVRVRNVNISGAVAHKLNGLLDGRHGRVPFERQHSCGVRTGDDVAHDSPTALCII